MVKTFYALSDRSVGQFKQFLRNTQTVSGEAASPLQIRMKFAKLTEAAPAAATDELNKSDAKVWAWDPFSTPATLEETEVATVEVWNPHNVELPSGTLCIIGKFAQGWVIVSPVNWCPPE